MLTAAAAEDRASHPPGREPSVKATRDVLPEGSRSRSMATGVAYFTSTAFIYLVTLSLAATADSWPPRIAFAIANGLTAGMMFIVGHDACHGSLTPSSKVNGWLGRAAFLPAWHPFASWEYSHNTLHHGFTNLRGKDPVYCPLTLEEFRALSRARQWLERVSRSWFGMLPLYLVTIWWPLEINPRGEHRRRIARRRSFVLDRALVGLFIVLETATLIGLQGGGLRAGTLTIGAAAARAGFVVVAPFLSFAWLMGFATFQHHTHQRVIWYADEAEWTFFRSQVEGTVHVVFPRWIELLLHNIMEHTAHHVDTRVPLYRLNDAQRAVEDAFGPERVITERFSFAAVSRVFRECQLYDYAAHRWLTFDGTPTTRPRRLESLTSRPARPAASGPCASCSPAT
jgi:omega-6 fatty acid desaturase (delta-12 desaturase)